jgi:hypothetical protein
MDDLSSEGLPVESEPDTFRLRFLLLVYFTGLITTPALQLLWYLARRAIGLHRIFT